ncbi:dipeptidase domain-containing protein [Stagonosporopsis vannaccii]|nr:dipeptidase domain-containing protein [Stagonosporopsis vannaccii]
MLSGTLPLFALLAEVTTASYAFYVGKALTEDGSVMVGGTGEEVSSHWLEIFAAKDFPPNATVEVGVTEDASMPGRRLNISQAAHTFRYISMEYSDYEGFPAPLTNGGLNEKGVAVRDVWAQNRDDLIAMTPNPQTGLQYSDLARVVMERASTARQGVEIIGQLIAEYGYADYGGNSHLIADRDEGWVVWEMSGGEKLWAAERLGPDDVRVLYPGYIEDFPVDFANSTDYMGSPNIVSFAVEQGWWNPNGTEPFNIWKAYGTASGNYTARDGGYKYMSQAALEDATRAMAPVSEKDLIARVRDFRIADDEAGYGQVVSLHADTDPDLLRIWVAPTSSVTAPFIPWWLGVHSVPPEYGQHRYLTADAASTFLDPDFQFQEATHFAGRVWKQALYYTCSDPAAFLPVVQDMLHGFENGSFADMAWVERSAAALAEKGLGGEARDLLTFYAHARAEKALALGRTVVDALDAYVKLTGAFRSPSGSRINDPGLGAETVNCLVGWDPDQPAEAQRVLRRRR